MIWKAIGQSVIGASHSQIEKPCEDAICYKVMYDAGNKEVLVCCVSDGAGSAKYAAEASSFVTSNVLESLCAKIEKTNVILDNDILGILEDTYEALYQKAIDKNENINEFSCTVLGAVLFDELALFFQIGDGAIIRTDSNNFYTTVWWPHNGEYSNTTSFLVDDCNMPYLKKVLLHEKIEEIAILTDGLQQLTLNTESLSVHQPFFSDLFKWLRLAKRDEDVEILNKKLALYLSSDIINNRTDDDKTLFLATRL